MSQCSRCHKEGIVAVIFEKPLCQQCLNDLIGLMQLATIALAGYPPERPSRFSSEAKVPWTEVTELRDVLDAYGIDWKRWNKRFTPTRTRRPYGKANEEE